MKAESTEAMQDPPSQLHVTDPGQDPDPCATGWILTGSCH